MIIPKKLTAEEFKEYFKNNYKNKKLVDDYTDGNTKVKVRCLVDDNEWLVFPRNVYSGEHMNCSICNKRKANYDLKVRFDKRYAKLRIVSRDIFEKEKVDIQCKVCKQVFSVYRKHLIGSNIINFNEPVDVSKIVFFKGVKKELVCPHCKINDTKALFYENVKSRNAKVVGEYVSNTASVTIECNVCHTQFGVVPNYYNDKLHSNCKYCKKDKKEKEVKSWDFLEKHRQQKK